MRAMRQDHLIVPWKPHAKQRPRVANNRAYTPKATKDAEARIVEAFLERWTGEPYDTPLEVRIDLANEDFDIHIMETEDYVQRKLRGDIDNYAKTILDALNGIAWVDDSQIRELRMRKG